MYRYSMTTKPFFILLNLFIPIFLCFNLTLATEDNFIHEGTVTALALSPDDKWLLSGGHDSTVRLWDLSKLKPFKLLLDQRDVFVDLSIELPRLEVMAVAIDSQGEFGAAGIRNRTVHVWNLNNGEEIQVLRGHEAGVLAVAFSPDSLFLASGGHESIIRIWDLKTGEQILSLNDRQREVRSLVFTPDGKTLFSSSLDGHVRIWDLVSGRLKKKLYLSCGPVNEVTISQTTPLIIAAGCHGDEVIVWDRGLDHDPIGLPGHKSGARSVFLSADGKVLVSGDHRGNVRLWDVTNRRQEKLFKGHWGEIRSVVLSSEKDFIVSAGDASQIKYWSLNNNTSRFLSGTQVD